MRPLKNALIAFVFISLFMPYEKAAAAAEISNIGEVVVTALKAEEETVKLAASTTVITAKDIERSTATNIPELLRGVEGLTVRDLYGAGSKATVDMRGFTNGLNTVVLIDGRKVNEIDLSGVDWNLISLESVERIEIVRGPANVLYGDNASAGVINIITKKGAAEGFSFSADARAESYGGNIESARASFGVKDVSLMLTASDKKTDGYRDNSEFSSRDMFARLSFTPAGPFYFDVSASLHDDHQGYPGGLTEAELKADRRQTTKPLDNTDYDKNHILVTAGYNVNAQNNVEVSYGKSEYGFDSLMMFFGSPYTLKRDTDQDEAKLKFTSTSKINGSDNLLVAGMERHAAAADSSSLYLGWPSEWTVKKKETGFFIEDEYSITGALTAAAGYRRTKAVFDESTGDRTFWEDSFRLGLTYNHTPGGKVFVSYGRGFRLPTTDEASFAAGELRPEVSDTVEAGMVHPLGAWDANARVTAFRTETEDEIHWNPTLGLWGANENLPSTRRTGAELGFSATPVKSVSFDLNATVLNAKFASGPNDGKTLPLVPKLSANASVAVRPVKDLSISANWRLTGSRYLDGDEDNSEKKLEGSSVFDIKASYAIERVEVYAGVKNLLNDKYSDYGVDAGWVNAFYPSPERWYYVGIKMSL